MKTEQGQNDRENEPFFSVNRRMERRASTHSIAATIISYDGHLMSAMQHRDSDLSDTDDDELSSE